MMFWYGSHWVFWQAALMWIGMIIFWGLLIWGVYALITGYRRAGAGPGAPRADGERTGGDAAGQHRPDAALRILDERLAEGAIDDAEYRRLRELILSGRRNEPAGAGAKE